ncbi:uncharacterized protein LOC133193173 [Saccostrea echinata]|uniref:uncharacterized protein LOC133193173 n=1 Tax=Saccostrea echinata TaxID=191078 RepID=UPI002A7F56B5|nr:uncharacterized protein LOC133193173 [Saccostrea echinata]
MDPYIRAQELIQCDLCKTEMVQIHCDTCHVKLCNTCIGEHMTANDSTKKHEIVRFIFRKSIPIFPQCSFHDKEKCEMYCKQCEVPVCITCIASEQHSILDERKEKIIKERKELCDTILPTYVDIASKVENMIEQLEKEYEDLSITITKHGTMKKHLDEIKEKICDIKDGIKSIDVETDSQDISKFFNIKFDVLTFRKLPLKVIPHLPKFTPGTAKEEDFCNLFRTLSSGKFTFEEHGYSIKTTEKPSKARSSPPSKQLLDEPEIINTIHTEYETFLNNVACVRDEEIWTSGIESMKLFSISQGSLLKTIKTKTGYIPSDIAVTKHGHLIYSDHRDRTVNIVKNEEIETLIRLQNWIPRNICSTSCGDLLVVMNRNVQESKVVRYSGSIEKQTIQFDYKGKPLFSSHNTKYIHENKNLDICVADFTAGEVVVVSQAGKLRFRYTGHISTLNKQSFRLRGITTDSQSFILIADFNNECVHIIDQDGQFLSCIYCGLRKPLGLCIDTNDYLFVAQWENRQVKKIKYLSEKQPE